MIKKKRKKLMKKIHILYNSLIYSFSNGRCNQGIPKENLKSYVVKSASKLVLRC